MTMVETAVQSVAKRKKLSACRSSEEKRSMVQSAAWSLKNFAEAKREVKAIKADKELFAAARALLKQEIADIKSSITS